MSNILDYMKWRGDISFSSSSFNAVDALLFSVISHIDFGGIVPATPDKSISLADAADVFFKKNHGTPEPLGAIVPDAVFDALELMMKSERFKSAELTFYADRFNSEKEQQFSAITVILPENQGVYIAFRGTDDTLIGWKEDFNMSFMKIVPSQIEAVRYVEKAAETLNPEKIYVGGHSKGGNLAAFGGSFCSESVAGRIEKIFCSDSPGFSKEVAADEKFLKYGEKIIRLIPEMSIVGMLLDNPSTELVVKSTAKGVFQHDPFSWEVLGNDFVYSEKISEGSLIIKNTIDKWLAGCSAEQLSGIVNSLYVFLSLTESSTLTELNNNRSKLLKSMKNMSSETKKSILQLVKLMTNAEGSKLKNDIKKKFIKGGGQ